MHPWPRLLNRASLSAAAVLAFLQACYLLPWALNHGGVCDFPQQCLAQSYPRAFAVSHALAWAFLAAGLAAVAASVIARSSGASIARLGIALAVGLAGFAVSPFARIDDPRGWTDAHAPVDLGGAWAAEALFVIALAVYGWEVVRRLYALEAEQESRTTAVSGSR